MMPLPVKLMVIDDDENYLADITALVKKEFGRLVDPIMFSSRDVAIRYIKSQNRFDVIVCDVCLNAEESLFPELSISRDLLAFARKINPESRSILVSMYDKAILETKGWAQILCDGTQTSTFARKGEELELLFSLLHAMVRKNSPSTFGRLAL